MTVKASNGPRPVGSAQTKRFGCTPKCLEQGVVRQSFSKTPAVKKPTTVANQVAEKDLGPAPAASSSAPRTRVPVNEVVVAARLRRPSTKRVGVTGESMATRGQVAPIIVRKAESANGTRTVLVDGLARLKAAKLLGWQHIDAVFMIGDEVDGRLCEILQNLFQADAKLTALEDAEHIAEYVKQIALKAGQVVHPVVGGRQPHDRGIAKAARELPIAGKTQEARRKTIERALKVAAISSNAKFAAIEAKLDHNRSALLTIAKEPTAELQLKKALELAAGKKQRPTKATGTSDRPSVPEPTKATSDKPSVPEPTKATGDKPSVPEPTKATGKSDDKPSVAEPTIGLAESEPASDGDQTLAQFRAAWEHSEVSKIWMMASPEAQGRIVREILQFLQVGRLE